MYVLGIETSCDETAVSVVEKGRWILSNEVSSSLSFHKKYGGIIPEIASRMQLETITAVADKALKQSGLKLGGIGLISVTSGPGLVGSLLVGISFAKALSLSRRLPLVGVNHVHSHIYANFLNGAPVELPFVALVVSGGHTSLFYVRDFDRIELMGQTRDDACGEAFDKVARILGLGYPGGPFIEKRARRGDARKIKFRCWGTSGMFDFSFSGIKTAVLYYLRDAGYAASPGKGGDVALIRRYPAGLVNDIAASFQEAVFNALTHKALLACAARRLKRLVVGGGVAINSRLREKFLEAGRDAGVRCYFPAGNLCMDNAAMVAGFGYQLYKRGIRSGLDLSAQVA